MAADVRACFSLRGTRAVRFITTPIPSSPAFPPLNEPSSTMSQTLRLYPLSNFTFSTKEAQPEEDPSVAARLQRLQNNYEDFGMRRTVEGVLVVHVSIELVMLKAVAEHYALRASPLSATHIHHPRSFADALFVQDHGHPHILMLQIANAFFKL